MSNAKFTPGPWIVCPGPEDPEIGEIYGSGIDGYDGTAVVWVSSGRGEGGIDNIHDAFLIAAAPELYDALASIENDDGSIPAAIWDMRNAALAKANDAEL